MSSQSREIQTVMHPLKTRMLQVKEVRKLAPHMIRVTLTGDDLSGFVSASPDDHVKVFFPYPGQEKPVVPILTPNGPVMPEGELKPQMRDYTPRRFDAEKKELDIDFYLHKEGIGAQWAAQAKPGQTLAIGGPRGSKIVPYNFDWYLLIGDESAIPSISRRLQELPKDKQAFAIIEVESAEEEVQLELSPNTKLEWIHRNGNPPGNANLLKDAILKQKLPPGDYFTWIATEKSCAMELKDLLITVKGAAEEWIKATGYWHK